MPLALQRRTQGYFPCRAAVFDSAGALTTTVPDSIALVVNAAPTATWVTPIDGTTFTAPANVTLSVTASDSDGSITKVDFYNGTTLIGSIATGQTGYTGNNYSFSWTNVQGGSYPLSAIATDNNGATVNAGTISVSVNNPPTIALTSPLNNSSVNVGTPIILSATASDSDGSISQVDFYNGTTLIGSIATGQAGNTGNNYTFSWANAASGSYTLSAIATDNQNTSTTSIPVSVNVNALPMVALTSPLNNSSVNVGTPIILSASASDNDGSISQVDFYNGTTLIDTVLSGSAGDTGSGYTTTWSNIAPGTYQLTAKATDNNGARVTTTPVTVTVKATAATIYYIHPDHLGTPRAITTSDTANTKVWEWKNEDAFGNNAPNEDPSATGTAFKYNLRFPGQYFDSETNTNYNYYRDYDPAKGRYVQSDPIGLKGGLNTFAYVGGNPLSYTDPLGLFTPSVHNEITVAALAVAGGVCLNLPADVANVDWLDGSQNPKNAHWHAMRDGTNPNATPGTAQNDFNEYVSGQWKSCSCSGLARALHAVQDSFARGHAGNQPWSGGLPTPAHGYHDGYPKDERKGAEKASADLITKFKNGCKGSCPK